MARRPYQDRTGEEGFTLALVAILLVVAAIIAANVFQKSKRDEFWIPKVETQRKLETITDVLIAYQREYRKLPCPAPLNVSTGNASHGVAAGSCAGGNAAIGAVPYKDLKLSSEYGKDSWGDKILYAVSPILTSNVTYAGNAGTITVNDNGKVYLEVAFVVLSHGVDRKGAYRDNATSIAVACGGAANGADYENCDNDADFVIRSLYEPSGANHFDDLVQWRLVDFAAQNM